MKRSIALKIVSFVLIMGAITFWSVPQSIPSYSQVTKPSSESSVSTPLTPSAPAPATIQPAQGVPQDGSDTASLTNLSISQTDTPAPANIPVQELTPPPVTDHWVTCPEVSGDPCDGKLPLPSPSPQPISDPTSPDWPIHPIRRPICPNASDQSNTCPGPLLPEL